MSNERIYCVVNVNTGEEHLRITTHPSKALRHVTHQEFEVTVPSALDVAHMIARGVQPVRIEDKDVVTE